MRTVCVFVAITGCWSVSVFGQLGHATVDGLRIDVRRMDRYGDTRDLVCSVGMDLQGEKVATAPCISSARVLRAIDDADHDQLRTNARSGPFVAGTPTRWADSFWVTFELKSPADSAKHIRLLECEVELPAGTSNSTTQQKLRFSLENIRLPWREPTDMQVQVGSPCTLGPFRSKSSDSQLLLTFVGGRIPGAAGMRELRILRAEDEAGRVMAVGGSESQRPPRFSPLESDLGMGRCIQREVALKAQTPKPTKLRVLQGEAELCFPNLTNGGIVEFNDFLHKKGEPLRSGALESSRVKLTFVDRDNFTRRKSEWQQNRATFITVVPRTAMPTNVMDSLQFTVDDPENRAIELEFLAPNGKTLSVLTTMGSTETLLQTARTSRIYTFESPPPKGTRLRLHLAAPAATERVEFKLENVPL